MKFNSVSKKIIKVLDPIERNSGIIRRIRAKVFYQALSQILGGADIVFFNYGFDDLDHGANLPDLEHDDEPDRYYIQLYHHVASQIVLRGLKVLEVGSGRGGGASYVARYFKPKEMMGIDYSTGAVKFCNEYYSVDSLSFFQGNAESLQFQDDSFDAIINVESSHIYGRQDQFFKEVFRVLRPGGHFLFTDFRRSDTADKLTTEIIAAGLKIIRNENIASNVVGGMDKTDESKVKIINKYIPRLIRGLIYESTGLVGSQVYRDLESGAMVYLSLTCQKQKKVR
ncbi:MAG: class I SAM-dependent methyltransferase [Chloroflexi bacterium]|nr:class I SAM-dependent methyltransferase [Chloroflexota bacterium]